ncbi:MAG: 30S ribosomal protein S12 methylthiotransferase RimO [Anaerolineae bacterium]|nr:30S ribosomal protein S12 methylthiotransferase RimO [Anaerolineae bacterium]
MLSLGCAKNTVDSDSMAQLLGRSGFTGTDDPAAAGVLIVNTCGFIEVARRESVAELRSLAAAKRPGQMLIAAGCLAQRYGAQLAEWVPGLDGIIGARRWMDIVDVVQQLGGRREPLYYLPDAATVGADERGVLRASRQGASAYLKIADGCRRPCAFCAIPIIKGTAVSRPLETIAAEAARLQDMGVKELVLIAQDSTDYGHDLGMKDGLAALLEAIVKAAPRVPWVRVMYAYPGCITDRFIDVMAAHPQILPYIDMPLQHASRPVLLRMRRPANLDWVYRTLDKLRARMPDLALRTTFIVGYPGETEAEFGELVDFIRDVQFDRVGAFTYSFEEGTPSADLPGHLPEEVKQERLDALMEAQQAVSLARNQALVGRTFDVLIEGRGEVEDEPGTFVSVGRSYRDAPEIDGLVFVEGEHPVGTLVPVQIGGAMVYDLIGEPMQEEN